jgi:hypothetical protein
MRQHRRHPIGHLGHDGAKACHDRCEDHYVTHDATSVSRRFPAKRTVRVKENAPTQKTELANLTTSAVGRRRNVGSRGCYFSEKDE